jgi:hypothetical protein
LSRSPAGLPGVAWFYVNVALPPLRKPAIAACTPGTAFAVFPVKTYEPEKEKYPASRTPKNSRETAGKEKGLRSAKKKPRPVLPVKKKGTVKKKTAPKKNKLGVKNSLVNNINARRKKGIARSKKKSSLIKKSYRRMKTNWDE